MDVKAHTKVLPDQPPDPFGCPQLGRVAQRLGSPRQKSDQRPALPSGQLRRTTGPGPSLESLWASLPGLGKPLTNGRTADTETAGDIGLGNTVAIEVPRLKAALFEGHGISSFCHTTNIIHPQPNVN
jgi:hypothetical protein